MADRSRGKPARVPGPSKGPDGGAAPALRVLFITEADGAAGAGHSPVDSERLRSLLSALPAHLIVVDVVLPAEEVLSSLPGTSPAARLVSLAGGGAPKAAMPAPDAALTRREGEVLGLIEQGLANKEIARCLGIGLPTVKKHVHSLLGKLGARSRGEAAAQARRWQTLAGDGPPATSPDPYRPARRGVGSAHAWVEPLHDPRPHRRHAGDPGRHHRRPGGGGSGHDGHRQDGDA